MDIRSTSLAKGWTKQNTESDSSISAAGTQSHVIEHGESSQGHDGVEDGRSLSSEQSGVIETQHLSTSATDAEASSMSLKQPQQVLHPKKGLSETMSTLIVINFISVSYILIPGGFAAAGTLLGTFILIIVTFLSYLTAFYVLEACARAETLALVQEDDSLRSTHLSVQVRHRKYELSLLNRIFLGKRWAFFFLIATILDMYGITWAFCTIFGSALADEWDVPGIENDYAFFVGIFMLVAVPLSCTSIVDQIYVQMTFLAARMVMVALMISTLIVAFAEPNGSFFGEQVGPLRNVPLANWSGTTQAIQTAVFATAFQTFVPAIGNVSRDKGVIGKIFRRTAIFIFVSNLVLGLLVSIYFGVATNESNNLNWSNYQGGTQTSQAGGRAIWATFIAKYVVLFAAFDGIVLFPLVTMTLGETLMGAVYGNRVHEVEKDWRIRIAFRLVASIPEAIGAMFVRSLGKLALYAAIFTILCFYVSPAMLRLSSEQSMLAKGLPSRTLYTCGALESRLWAYALLVLSLLVILAVILQSSIQPS